MTRELWKGNEAIAEAAVRAGVEAYFGYPITPQTEILEYLSKITPGTPEPLFTRFLVCEMSTSHYFNISAAKNELNYKPKYSVSEAMKACFN